MMRLFERNEYSGRRRERGGVRGQGVRMRIKKKKLYTTYMRSFHYVSSLRFEMFRAFGDEIG